jgi:hypothetical protein
MILILTAGRISPSFYSFLIRSSPPI